MSGTRALFASIGASVSLVAAAALSLLAVSAVFAFGGWSDPVAESARQTALILDDGRPGPARTIANKPIVLPARAQAPARREVARVTTPPQPAPAADQAGIADSSRSRPAKASYQAPPVADPQPQSDVVTPPAPAAPKKSAADGVRPAGEDLSGKVQGTADALAQITDPLLPPVAAATQKVLNAVAELLRHTTNGLAGTLDGVR
jgi:hypothetical protein